MNDKINAIIDKIPFLVKLPADIGFDFRMSSKPTYRKEFLSVPLRTEFFDWANRKPSRFKPIEMPNTIHNDKMAHTMISNFPGLTMGDIIYQKKLLNVWVTDDQIPPPIPFRLNTKSFIDVFPNFDKIYPDSEIKIHVTSPMAPSFLFKKTGFVGQIPIETKWYAIDSETGQSKLGFSLIGGVGLKGIVGLSRMNVTAKLDDIIFQFKSKDSSIGEVQWEKIQELADFFIAKALKKFFNDFLSTTGIPLPPIPHFQITNPFFKYEDGFAGLSIDGEYIVTLTKEKESIKKSYCIDCRQSIQIIERNIEKSKNEIKNLLKNICLKYNFGSWMRNDCLKIVHKKIEEKVNYLELNQKLSPVVICDRIKACRQ